MSSAPHISDKVISFCRRGRRKAAGVLDRIRLGMVDLCYRPGLSQPVRDARRYCSSINGRDSALAAAFFRTDPRKVAKRFPEWMESLKKTGEDCDAGRVSIGEAIRLSYSPSFDWSQDPNSGFSFPMTYSRRFKLPQRSDRGDYRLIWEIARLQWCVTWLLAAYLHDRNDWARSARNVFEHFMRSNPLRRGIHWFSAMEVALRLYSWMQADALLSWFAPELRSRDFRVGLIAHASELSRTVTTHWEVPNNHLIIEAAALAVFGALYPDLPQAPEYRQRGREILRDQVLKQTFDDGVNREMSPAYQRFVTESVLIWHFAAVQAGCESGVDDWLNINLDALAALRAPGGLWPMISDSDGGRVIRWEPSRRFGDFDACLYASALALGRAPSSKWEVCAEGVLLAGESREFTNDDRANRWKSRSSGIKVHRNEAAFLVVRGGELGLGGEDYCGHAHSDLGSLHLWLDTEPLLQDSGTERYHGFDENWWLACRRCEAHNVVSVDDREQMTPYGAFGNRELWRCDWTDSEKNGGTLMMSSPCGQRRWKRRYALSDQRLEVNDVILGSTRGRSRIFIPFGVGWKPRKHDNSKIVLNHPRCQREVVFRTKAKGRFETCFYHPDYSARVERVRWTGEITNNISWELSWEPRKST